MDCSQFFYEPHMPERAVVIIFGGSGDLTRRKIIPAFFNLGTYGNLPAEHTFIAVGRKEMDTDALRGMFPDAPPEQIKNLHYARISSYDTDGCRELQQTVADITGRPLRENNYLFYMAVPPQSFVPIAQGLKGSGWVFEPGGAYWTRLVVEKPYGKDYESAVALNEGLLAAFCEKQIYRIDHYLGKEAVQNLLVFRFANLIFDPVWNRNYIDNIQISAFEDIGVEKRGAYYDTYGVTRDMMQNHLMQLLTLVTMEAPVTLNPDDIRNAKVNILRQVRSICFDGTCRMHVRGQYGPGNGMPGYRQEEGVPDDSGTETYAALKVFVDNQRWDGVPIYLRSGKSLNRKGTMIVVQFKELPKFLYNAAPDKPLAPNRITFVIQPDEGIILEVANKTPGYSFNMQSAGLDFYYQDEFEHRVSEAYERLVLDALLGDNTLFVRSDETALSWKFFDPLLAAWKESPAKNFPNYAAGSGGPAAADTMLQVDGRSWVPFEDIDAFRDK